VNETAVEGFYNDAMKFGKLWLDTTQNERENVRKALADAYENAAARMLMNFGKTVVPIVSDWAELSSKI
jgi:acyl-CoA reductase-like NAD-dependent aldehyde dehydrogenase